MYTNAQSIMNKLCELSNLMNEKRPDVCCITEFGAGENVLDSEITIAGYTIYRKNHESGTGGPGKGLAIYVKDTLFHSCCLEMTSLNTNTFDCAIWVRIKLSAKSSIVVGNVYRSPSANDDKNLALLESLKLVEKLKDTHFVVMGDFNLPKINWLTGEVKDVNDSFSMKFIESIETMG